MRVSVKMYPQVMVAWTFKTYKFNLAMKAAPTIKVHLTHDDLKMQRSLLLCPRPAQANFQLHAPFPTRDIHCYFQVIALPAPKHDTTPNPNFPRNKNVFIRVEYRAVN